MSFIIPDNQIDKISFSNKLAFTERQILHFFDETRWSRTFQIVR